MPALAGPECPAKNTGNQDLPLDGKADIDVSPKPTREDEEPGEGPARSATRPATTHTGDWPVTVTPSCEPRRITVS